jgi:DNA-nicking Smr family endonuclease
MKKKKAGEKIPPDFRNNPFKSLKGLAPAPTKKTVAPMQRVKEAPLEDEASLFLKAVSGVRKIEQVEDIAAGPAARKTAIEPDSGIPEERLVFLEAMKKMGATLRDSKPEPDDTDESGYRSPSSRMRQLKRGTIRISEELDLHGFLRDEALARLQSFITAAHGRGLEAVLVITGKGVNSPEGPVLQGAVAAWLRERGKGIVAEFSPAPRDKGGTGAFVVFLKKK